MFIERLAQYRNFVLYDTSLSEGHPDYKKPLRIVDGKGADSTDSNDWCSYDEAVAVANNYPKYGIGFVLTNTPLSCIDLDSYKTTDESILNLHKQIHDGFNTYSELSPNGGVHIWCEGDVEARKLSTHYLEVYSTKRYITITNKPLNNVPISNRQELLQSLIHQIDSFKGKSPNKPTTTVDAVQTLPDEKVIELASVAANGQLFQDLFVGKWKDYFSSQSEADLTLCNIIAYYTDNRAQVGRIFRASELGKRGKAKRDEYLFHESWGIVTKSFDQKLSPEALEAIAKSIKSKVEIIKQEVIEAEIEDTWMLPPGLLGECIDFIFKSSIYPMTEISIAAGIAFMAGFCGRAFNTETDSGLNQYIVMLADTAAGKEGAATGISKLTNSILKDLGAFSQYTGPSTIASASGLLKWLNQHPCFLSQQNEVGYWLQKLTHPRANANDITLKGMLLAVYSKSGSSGGLAPSAYSDAKNATDFITSPCVSIIGDSTPKEFYKALTERNIEEGLVSRFTNIECPAGKMAPYKPDNATYKVPESLQWKLKALAKIAMENEKIAKVTVVKQTPEAREFELNYNEQCRIKYAEDRNNPASRIWTRAHLRLLRLGALIAVGVDPVKPLVTPDHYQWAEVLINRGVTSLTSKFSNGDIGENSNRFEQRKEVVRFFNSYFQSEWSDKLGKKYRVNQEMFALRAIPYAVIHQYVSHYIVFRNDHDPANALKSVLSDLVASGSIIKAAPEQIRIWNKRGDVYLIIDVV